MSKVTNLSYTEVLRTLPCISLTHRYNSSKSIHRYPMVASSVQGNGSYWPHLCSFRANACMLRLPYDTLPFMQKVLHPHISIAPDICGGSPRIEGTRITVRTVVVYVLHHGLSPEELLVYYPHLNLASIYDALSYYYDNREEIDREIADNDALDPAIRPIH